MRVLIASLALVASASVLPAQNKQSMIADYTRAKATVLAYIDAMPDSALGFRPTPGVRSFAEQIDHIVLTHYQVAAMVLEGATEEPSLGDTAVYLHNKAALRAASAKAFDAMLRSLEKAPPAVMSKVSAIFGAPPAPGWKWIAMSFEHGTWTLGQVVPYLRLNKVTPPTYQIPF
ncbi:MAG: DinB family protein [Gemmatimonadaceae bacterium]